MGNSTTAWHHIINMYINWKNVVQMLDKNLKSARIAELCITLLNPKWKTFLHFKIFTPKFATKLINYNWESAL